MNALRRHVPGDCMVTGAVRMSPGAAVRKQWFAGRRKAIAASHAFMLLLSLLAVTPAFADLSVLAEIPGGGGYGEWPGSFVPPENRWATASLTWSGSAGSVTFGSDLKWYEGDPNEPSPYPAYHDFPDASTPAGAWEMFVAGITDGNNDQLIISNWSGIPGGLSLHSWESHYLGNPDLMGCEIDKLRLWITYVDFDPEPPGISYHCGAYWQILGVPEPASLLALALGGAVFGRRCGNALPARRRTTMKTGKKHRSAVGSAMAMVLVAFGVAGARGQLSPEGIDAVRLQGDEAQRTGAAWHSDLLGTQRAIAKLNAEAPQAIVYEEGSRITRVAGQPLAFGATPEASAAAFVQAHSAVFGLQPEELVPGNTFDGRYAQPLMYEPATGTHKFTLVYYTQYRGGLPVFRGELRVLARNEAGNPAVWAGSSLRNLGAFAVPARAAADVAESEAHATAARLVPGLVNFGPYELVIWAGADDMEASPAVAITFVADNGLAATGEYEKWLFVVDAATAEVLYKESQIIYTDVVGNVQGMATDGVPPKADVCNPENPVPFKWAKVGIGSTVAYTDPNGDFTIPNVGDGAATVTSYMSGRYFVVNDEGGPLETLSLSVTPPGPADFMHNAANASEFIRAEVNGYVQANVVRDFCLNYEPDYPTIATQTGFPVNVNISASCNAYYDGSSINFYRAAGGCANTAYSSVIHHEYGHHMVACGGSGQGQYGEGMGDSIGVVIADDPVCGYGFQLNCNAGIRTADNTMQYPCTSEIHTCAQLLSGCIWSTRNALRQSYPDTYLEILRPLAISSILLHTGTQITPQIAIDFLTLDDNDGNINNGTPHRTEICAGFGAHNMTCPLPVVGLSVTPAGGLESSGPVGGPFWPDGMAYTLENLNDTPIEYNVSGTQAWVTVSNPSGALSGHATTTVTVSVNSGANSLPSDMYADTVTFTNVTDHVGDTTRPVTLRIGTAPVLSNYDTWPDGVEPDEGGLETPFAFRVHYYDADGTAPSVAQVVIDGQAYVMAGTGSDADYLVAVAGSGVGCGTDNYHFHFEDATHMVARLPASGEWQFTVGTEPALIAYWPFDEAAGSVAHDATCFHNDGTIVGAAWVNGPGSCGAALEFTNQALVEGIPASFDDSVTTGLTVAAWVYQYGATGTDAVIFDGRASNGGSWLGLFGNGNLGFILYGSPGTVVVFAPGPSPQVPAHVAAVFDDNADLLSLYLNGTLVGTLATTHAYYRTSLTPAIGNNRWAPGDGQWRPFNGIIDEVRIYNRALSADEVMGLYRACRACPGDMNCDNNVTYADINLFVEALAGESAWNQHHPDCPWLNADCDGDGHVTFGDIDPFVALMGTTCP